MNFIKPTIVTVRCSLKEEIGIISLAKDISSKLGLEVSHHRISASNYLYSVNVCIAFVVRPTFVEFSENVKDFEEMIKSKEIFQ